MRFADLLPGWVTFNKVLLCMHLSGMIYEETVLPATFTHYYSNTGGGRNQRFFVVSHDTDLFLVIRGADSVIDYTIASDFEQVPFQNGLAHRGLLNASKFVLSKTREIIEKWKGNVFVVGHSTGGGTAGLVVASLVGDGMKNVYGVLVGPIPSATMNVGKKYRKNILTLQNLNDVITFQTVRLMRNLTSNFINHVNSGSVRGLRSNAKKLIGWFEKRMPDISPVYVEGMKVFVPNLLEHIENSFKERYKQFYHLGTIVAFKSGQEPMVITKKSQTHELPPITKSTLGLHSVDSYIDAVMQTVVDEYLSR